MTGWSDAPCYGLTDLFFDPSRAREAKKLCAGCSHTVECAALSEQATCGVWAGVTVKRLTLSPRARKAIAHGTRAGYAQHLRCDVPPCDECRRAHNERKLPTQREWRARNACKRMMRARRAAALAESYRLRAELRAELEGMSA